MRLPPGRFKLSTIPSFTGSLPLVKTTGIVDVAAFAARAEGGPPPATMTETGRRTSSAASAGSRSYSPCAQRYSMATFRPSTKPASSSRPRLSPATNDAEVSRERAVKKSNHRHRRLLRARRERPRDRRAAEQRDELAPFHSITSSARASRVGGTSRPSALAVFRLMTSSYLVGACTGRSAGFSPLRMRST